MDDDRPEMIRRAEAWIVQQRLRHLSRPVTYARGEHSVEVQAAVGRTEFEVDNGTGVLEKVESRDFLIRASDLVLDGTTVKPERGDRVREESDGVTYVYEVMAPGRFPEAHWSGRSRLTWRIHTKLVDTLEV